MPSSEINSPHQSQESETSKQTSEPQPSHRPAVEGSSQQVARPEASQHASSQDNLVQGAEQESSHHISQQESSHQVSPQESSHHSQENQQETSNQHQPSEPELLHDQLTHESTGQTNEKATTPPEVSNPLEYHSPVVIREGSDPRVPVKQAPKQESSAENVITLNDKPNENGKEPSGEFPKVQGEAMPLIREGSDNRQLEKEKVGVLKNI